MVREVPPLSAGPGSHKALAKLGRLIVEGYGISEEDHGLVFVSRGCIYLGAGLLVSHETL